MCVLVHEFELHFFADPEMSFANSPQASWIVLLVGLLFRSGPVDPI